MGQGKMKSVSDYINRDDVIMEIKRFKGYLDDDMITRLTIAIDRILSVDVVEVVRCERCKWWGDKSHTCKQHSNIVAGLICKTGGKDYCSCGKRRGTRE